MDDRVRIGQGTVERLPLLEAKVWQEVDAAVAAWAAVDAALSAVVGQRGMAALFKRSVQLTCPAHPWLSGAAECAAEPGSFFLLRSALSSQSAPVARAGHVALLATFQDVLARLVGRALAERLMRPGVSNTSAMGERCAGAAP
jgi:hypothetical protein